MVMVQLTCEATGCLKRIVWRPEKDNTTNFQVSYEAITSGKWKEENGLHFCSDSCLKSYDAWHRELRERRVVTP